MLGGFLSFALSFCAPMAWAKQEIAAPNPSSSPINPAGLYQGIGDGPDVASQLLLTKEGDFRFQLMAGALDLWSQGQWIQADNGTLTLNTAPRPKPPELHVQSMEKKAGAPISILVTTPKGRSIAGVDFVIGFDKGQSIEDYTQSDGWQADPAEKRIPRWISLREPIYDIILDQTPIPDGANDLRFTLIPNDVGVLDFINATGILREEDGETFLTVSMDKGSTSFVRLKPDKEQSGEEQKTENKP